MLIDRIFALSRLSVRCVPSLLDITAVLKPSASLRSLEVQGYDPPSLLDFQDLRDYDLTASIEPALDFNLSTAQMESFVACPHLISVKVNIEYVHVTVWSAPCFR